jgi:DNA-binding MarR family transcriptional regulator
MPQRAPQPVIPLDPSVERDWPGASSLATACFINMGFLYGRVVALIEAMVRRHGIPSMSAFNALTILHGASEPLLPSTIAERMVISRGTMTGIVASLERRGLVRRLAHSTDGRMRLVEVTPAGVERALAARAELHREEKRLLDCLTPAQQRQLLRTVARIQANLTPGG